MKKIALVLLLSCLTAVASLWAIDPDDLNEVTFVNNLSGGKNIEYLFVQADDTEFWGPDILGSTTTLDNKESAGFYVFYPEATAIFHYLAIDEDGDVYKIVDSEIEDGTAKTITFTDRNHTNETMNDLKLSEVIITNETEEEMYYIFFAPADSQVWGIEILNVENTLAPGDDISFLVLLSSKAFNMDFLALDQDNDEFQKVVRIGTREGTIEQSITYDDMN